MHLLVAHGKRVGGVERRETHEALVHHHAHRVQVGAPVERAPHGLFRRHVVRRSHGAAARGESRMKLRRGNAEIGEVGVAVVVEQHVVGLHVPVHHAMSVCVVERRRDLRGHLGDADRGNRALAREQVGQPTAAHERHDQIDHLAHLAIVERHADERVHQPRRRFRLAAEALAHLLVAREMRVHDLEHERAAQRFLLHQVDVGHAARADAPQHTVAVPRGLPQRRDQRVGDVGTRRDVGQRRRAAHARGAGAAVPGAAFRTEHATAPRGA